MKLAKQILSITEENRDRDGELIGHSYDESPYWVSPLGEIYSFDSQENHSEFIFQNRERILNPKELEKMDSEQESIDDSDAYEEWEYDRSLGVRDLAVTRGWLNIRNWRVSGEPRGAWMVTISRLNKRTIQNIEKWVDYMLKNYKGIQNHPVVIYTPEGDMLSMHNMTRLTFQEIEAGYLEVDR